MIRPPLPERYHPDRLPRCESDAVREGRDLMVGVLCLLCGATSIMPVEVRDRLRGTPCRACGNGPYILRGTLVTEFQRLRPPSMPASSDHAALHSHLHRLREAWAAAWANVGCDPLQF